jgi:hypothetical protein
MATASDRKGPSPEVHLESEGRVFDAHLVTVIQPFLASQSSTSAPQ